MSVFDREISHEEALKAAEALIDEHFNNVKDNKVKTCIPVEADDTDVVLINYITQQRKRK
jgi:hypothetical protein